MRDFNPFRPSLERGERKLLREITQEQVRKIDPSEYAVGSERYEKLMAGIERNQTFSWPQYMTEPQ